MARGTGGDVFLGALGLMGLSAIKGTFGKGGLLDQIRGIDRSLDDPELIKSNWGFSPELNPKRAKGCYSYLKSVHSMSWKDALKHVKEQFYNSNFHPNIKPILDEYDPKKPEMDMLINDMANILQKHWIAKEPYTPPIIHDPKLREDVEFNSLAEKLYSDDPKLREDVEVNSLAEKLYSDDTDSA